MSNSWIFTVFMLLLRWCLPVVDVVSRLGNKDNFLRRVAVRSHWENGGKSYTKERLKILFWVVFARGHSIPTRGRDANVAASSATGLRLVAVRSYDLSPPRDLASTLSLSFSLLPID